MHKRSVLLCGALSERRFYKTASEAKAEMLRRGETAADWARKHGVSGDLVRGVLSGRVRGRNGEAHKIAVLLGIKEGVIVENEGHEYA